MASCAASGGIPRRGAAEQGQRKTFDGRSNASTAKRFCRSAAQRGKVEGVLPCPCFFSAAACKSSIIYGIQFPSNQSVSLSQFVVGDPIIIVMIPV